MPPAAQLTTPWLVRTTALLRGMITRKKAPNIKANTFRLFFLSNGQRLVQLSDHDMRNCTHKVLCVVSFSFSVKAVAHCLGGSLLFFPRHVQYS